MRCGRPGGLLSAPRQFRVRATGWLHALRWLRALLCLALLPLTPTAPANAAENPQADEIRSQLATIQAQEQRLLNIGWRLTTGNAQFCPMRSLSIGLQLLDLASFREPQAIRQALATDGDMLIWALAHGGPAELAGLAEYQVVDAIEGQSPAAIPTADGGDWQRQKTALDMIDAALNDRGEVNLNIGGIGPIRLAGVQACRSRFEIRDGGRRALADGDRIQIGSDFPAFSYADDELAAAIAHELAHNILRHRSWLDEMGRKRRNIRLTEREADRLMPWLLANGGYDPGAALRFMQKWGPRHSGGIFRKRTHEGWDERADIIAAELEFLQQHWASGQPADWARYFKREIGGE